MKEKLIIFGTGGHAKVVLDIAKESEKFIPHAFVSLDENVDEFQGFKHVHQNDFLKLGISTGIIAIGDNYVRSLVKDYILSKCPDFNFISLVHPDASIGSDVQVGQGSVVMANAVLNCGVSIGESVIVNTSASIDHDCNLLDFSSVAPGATIGGNVEIGKFSVVSLGANVIHGVGIGDDTIIGAGATVVDNIPSNSVGMGLPCKVIRKRERGEKYL